MTAKTQGFESRRIAAGKHGAPRATAAPTMRRFPAVIAMACLMVVAVTGPALSDVRVAGGDDGGYWVCQAYGAGGGRNTWRHAMGSKARGKAGAKAAALAKCQRTLNGCRLAGCWPKGSSRQG
ncbi:MAG: hypothetical protein ACK5JT_14845 [Hyphomicrobiaceae bacterium]